MSHFLRQFLITPPEIMGEPSPVSRSIPSGGDNTIGDTTSEIQPQPLEEAITLRRYLSQISSHLEPTNFYEANTNLKWCKAMKEELQALKKNNTWDIIPLPVNKKLVGCKWIFKIKYNSDGTIERYKARLIARGFTQTYGVDYQETFTPVAKMNTVRILLSVATNQG
ncbi:uncharacterized mitochondrial protein AtMg00820-like [Ricinus communis]|uniref:uncharacterized mitochondrial protein AtMg00820-like n=1 Tax=Ricinus communis TaxID=3988 RepID=UPI00201B2EE6|nr:uncharacterized mitochondrial protein AtMg00820-like [Ricinus communis]